MRVLVTDAGYKHAVGIIRSLGRSGHEVTAVSASRIAPGFYSRYTHHWTRVSSPSDDPGRFVGEVLACAQRWECQLLVPVGFASCRAVAHHLDTIKARGPIAIAPPPELFETASDKWAITQLAAEAGLSVPDTILADDVATIKAAFGKFGQVVCKYRSESSGQGVAYIGSAEDADRMERTKPIGRIPNGQSNMIVQRCIRGSGAGYMALAWHGRVVREFAHRRRRELPVSGGAATAAESIFDPALMKAGRRLIEAIRWHGPAMVEFKASPDGYYFIEFNPKFWGSLELALAAGADFPGDLCRLASGEDLTTRPMPSYQSGLRFWWPWRGDLRRLVARPWDFAAVIGDLFSATARSNWWWRDPLPNLIEIGGEILYPLRRRHRSTVTPRP